LTQQESIGSLPYRPLHGDKQMLDPFLMEHHVLNTMEAAEENQHLLPDTIARAVTFARFPYAVPSSYQLLLTGHVQTHEKIFELHLSTTNVPYMMRLTPLERLLFDVIILHKLSIQLAKTNATDRERRSHIVLGCMIQHRLTRLLLNVHKDEIEKIFRLGQASGIDRNLWETHFIGATTYARTICTFLKLDDCRLFLPTVFEDSMLGIDLIVLHKQGNNWCISIKTGRQDVPMHIEHVHTRPSDEEPAFRSADRRRIFDGTRTMERLFNGTFHACRIMAGKLNGLAYDLNVYENDINLLSRFLNTKRSQRLDSHTQTQNTNTSQADDLVA
jgi:hypothetical protein